jgi:hypothetical protein
METWGVFLCLPLTEQIGTNGAITYFVIPAKAGIHTELQMPNGFPLSRE